MNPLLLTLAALSAPVDASNDTWMYGEAGGYCMAFFQRSPTQLVIRFSAKGDDETIQIWRNGLPSLTKGLDKSGAEGAAARHYDLSLIIAGKAIPLSARTGELKPKNVLGIAYLLGVDQKSFISALATGDTIEVRRNEQPVASYHVANSSTLAARLQACTAKP